MSNIFKSPFHHRCYHPQSKSRTQNTHTRVRVERPGARRVGRTQHGHRHLEVALHGGGVGVDGVGDRDPLLVRLCE